MRELFLLRWWVVGGGYQLPSAILDAIIPTTFHRSKNSFPHCLAAGSWKEVWNIGQDPANGSFCIVWGHTWIYGMSVTISPGRPEIPWPGDRQVVECGQHLGTWWRTCHFFFHCTIQQPRIAVQYSVIVEGNLVSCHQTHHHYDHFVFNHDSIDQAAMTAPCENEISLIPLEWLNDSG